MNRLMFLFYQTPSRKSTGFLYNTKKAIHPPQPNEATTMNRLILLSYQTLGKKSSEFYIIQKRRFIHRKPKGLATMNHLILLYYQTPDRKSSLEMNYFLITMALLSYLPHSSPASALMPTGSAAWNTPILRARRQQIRTASV